MTPEEKKLVRESWARLRADPKTPTLFYRRLFEMNPNARRLFGSKDMQLQGVLFMQMLALFIRGLDDDDPATIEALKASGQRHVGYGVSFSDYDTVGTALLAMIDQQLSGPELPAIRDAWAEAYRQLAATMQASSSVL